MIVRRELKEQAKKQIKGNIWFLLLCTIIIGALPFIFDLITSVIAPTDYSEIVNEASNYISNMALLSDEYTVTGGEDTLISLISIISGLVTIFFVVPLEVGLYNVYIHLYNNNKDKSVGYLFEVFKKGQYGRALKLQILMSIYIILWSLLFIVPGIIKAISYSQAYYLLLDDPNMSASEAIRKSKQMMRGHKAEYFVLGLSFFWWWILCFVTCGIAYIYVMPYVMMTFTCYHYKLVSETSGASSDAEFFY